MSVSNARTAHPYIAEVRNSQEVTLYGSAELAFWSRQLLPEKLVPVEHNGQARLMISAVTSRWLGVRFSEFMMAVLANPIDHTPVAGTAPGLYLLTAYNTSRPFTFIEQRYFQTPYHSGSVEVECGKTPSFRLKQQSSEMLYVVRRELPSTPPKVDEVWEGTIYLPPRLAKDRSPRNVFYARLEGLTEISPYSLKLDTIHITPTASEPVLIWLCESGFSGQEWHIRSDATHARSKTYPRD